MKNNSKYHAGPFRMMDYRISEAMGDRRDDIPLTLHPEKIAPDTLACTDADSAGGCQRRHSSLPLVLKMVSSLDGQCNGFLCRGER